MKDIEPTYPIPAPRHPCKVIAAVYFLFHRGNLKYIGQTLNLYSRLGAHREKCWFEWDSYAFVPADAEELYSLERIYIKKCNPPCNRIGKTSAANTRAKKRHRIATQRILEEFDPQGFRRGESADENFR